MIVPKINEIVELINKDGKEINGTKELTGLVISKWDVTKFSQLEEENSIRDYYEQKGIKTQVIRSLEHNLYEFIFRGLKQSVEQLFYFDKTQDFTSRRFVFSTTDCISHVQILYRNGLAELFVHIRSTDAKKLLPWDLLFCANLLDRILLECRFPAVKQKLLTVTIASVHYYLKPAALY